MKSLPEQLKAEFSVYTELKAPDDLSVAQMKDMYHKMNLIRFFDAAVADLWMDNAIYGLAHSYVGAEAIGVGACAALRPDDYITSTHRGHGHTISKGADVKKMMAELMGKYEGYNRGKGGSMHIADVENGMLGATGIVGSGMPIALGSAISANVLGNGKVTICFHGDGGTNQGIWHETINMAAAWNMPVVFLTENNQMAISIALHRVTKETNLYKRAAGYGISGVQVDGFNVFAVYEAVKAAVERARSGDGPTLIEARFMRLLGHSASDDQKYRDLKAVEPYWQLCPLKRMREFFVDHKVLSEEEVTAIENHARREVDDAIDYGRNQCTNPSLDTLYEDLYANGEVIL